MFMLVLSIGYVSAQGKADIKFDKTSHNFGTFSENDPVVSCVFTFTNVGDAPLVIHQAVASCGCTVPEYTQEPVLPGKTGTVKITYNGTGKYPGHFKKSSSCPPTLPEATACLPILHDSVTAVRT